MPAVPGGFFSTREPKQPLVFKNEDLKNDEVRNKRNSPVTFRNPTEDLAASIPQSVKQLSCYTSSTVALRQGTKSSVVMAEKLFKRVTHRRKALENIFNRKI